jgi:hypothetical protein
MLKKLILLVIVIVFVSSFTYAGPGLTPEQKSRLMTLKTKITVVGDAVVGVGDKYANLKGMKYAIPTKTVGISRFVPTGWITGVTYTVMNTPDQTMYDLLSNGTPNCIIQNSATPDHISAVYMWDNFGDPVATSPNRRSKYYYSTDRGVTWSFISNVPDTRTGYTVVDYISDGREVFANHPGAGTSDIRAKLLVDAFEGLGSFSILDAGQRANTQVIWPRFVPTSSITLPNKFVVVASSNSTTYDSTFLSIESGSLTPPGTWSPWTPIYAASAETYKVARGDDGRIGLVYIAPNLPAGSPDDGDIYFQESTDNGTTFTPKLKIWDCNFTTDSTAALRGLDIVYLGNSPKVVFEINWSDQAGHYQPANPKSCIRFWSPTLPGSDPNRSIIIADTTRVGYHPAIAQTGGAPTASNDVLTPMCRPGIGKSGTALFVSFMVPFGPADNSYIGGTPDTCSYNAIWLTASGDGGSSWKAPLMITPADSSLTGIRDWTFPSISKWNDFTSTTCYANIAVLNDSVPGSYYSHVNNGPAQSNFVFMRVQVPAPVFINTISTEVPNNYSLYQNYPNPFNPTTNIRFAIPSTSNVTINVYNVTGQLIETILKNETVSAGVKEVKFDASRLSSGIYFYTIHTGNFIETKKMVLLK